MMILTIFINTLKSLRDKSGRKIAFLLSSPLRTVRTSFPVHSSSLSKSSLNKDQFPYESVNDMATLFRTKKL